VAALQQYIAAVGTAIIALDAAAHYAGEMPKRADLTYFCSYPSDPDIFNVSPDVAARQDYFGGIAMRRASSAP
jgi:hypothetical protein